MTIPPPCGVFNSIEQLQHGTNTASGPDDKTKVKRLKDEGNTLAEAGRFRAAMSQWSKAIGIDPNDAKLYELLAQASMAVHEDFQAVQFARRATELAPMWSDGFLTFARCQLNFGELTLALEALEQVSTESAYAFTTIRPLPNYCVARLSSLIMEWRQRKWQTIVRILRSCFFNRNKY